MSNTTSTHSEAQRELRHLWNSYRTALATIGGLLVVIVALALAVLSQHLALRAERQSRAQCQLDKYVAEAPLGPRAPTPLGLHISAGSRIAYIGAHCKLGPLSPPDPRILPYLPKELRK